jgi:hypothetical protein
LWWPQNGSIGSWPETVHPQTGERLEQLQCWLRRITMVLLREWVQRLDDKCKVPRAVSHSKGYTSFWPFVSLTAVTKENLVLHP